MQRPQPSKAMVVVGGGLVITSAALGIIFGMDLFENDSERKGGLAVAQATPGEDVSSQQKDVPSLSPSHHPSRVASIFPSKSLIPSSSLPPTLSSMPTLRPSPSPSVSTVPSFSPTDGPSSLPSHSPSFGPSFFPSEVPSSLPSIEPSTFPSLSPSSYPSLSPTSHPSTAPSFNPTISPISLPSFAPSTSPTITPSFSLFPTFTPSTSLPPTALPTYIPRNYVFRLRLHWESGYRWQDSSREFWWCMACAECDLNIFDRHCETTSSCKEGNMMALVHCDDNRRASVRSNHEGAARYTMREGRKDDGTSLEGDQIQVHNTNFCLTRSGVRTVVLEQCDVTARNQRWIGFRPYGEPFEFVPLDRADKCLSQHHHPRAGERLYAEKCFKAQDSDTSLWVTY